MRTCMTMTCRRMIADGGIPGWGFWWGDIYIYIYIRGGGAIIDADVMGCLAVWLREAWRGVGEYE